MTEHTEEQRNGLMRENVNDHKDEFKTTVVYEVDKKQEQKVYTLDLLIKDLGQCGPFQAMLIGIGYFPIVPASWALVFVIFGNYNPGLTCQDDDAGFNSTALLDASNNTTMLTNDTRSDTDYVILPCTCDMLKKSRNWTFKSAASTIVTEWSLVCDDSWKAQLIIVAQMSGIILGALIGGQIGDRFGRKFSIHGSCFVLAVTNIVSIFSLSWQMYTALRFLIGFSTGSVLSSVVVYSFEFLSPWWRAFLGVFPFWSISMIFYSLFIYILRNWRHVQIVTATLAFLAFLPVFWLPESLRFLAVHGQLKRATQAVQKISRLNKKPVPDMTIIKRIAEVEHEALQSRSSYTCLDLCHSSVRKITVVIGLIWFVFSMTFYILGLSLSSFSGDFFINFLLFCALPIPSRLIAFVFLAKMGRKTVLLVLVLLSCICSFIIVAIQLLISKEKAGLPTTVLALALNTFIEAAWGLLVVYGNELFPTDIRTLAYGYCNAGARIAAIVAPYLIPQATMPIFGRFIIIGAFLMICFIGVLTLPETKGQPLRENLKQVEIIT